MMLCVSGSGSGLIHAQSSFDEYKRKAFEQFEQFKAEKQREFDAYRDRVNQEYAEYMRSAWPEFKAEPAIPAPPSPEPPAPIVVDPDAEPDDTPLPFSSVTPAPAPMPAPEPLIPGDESAPKPITPVQPKPGLSFRFYGDTYSVPFDKSLRVILRNIDENSVADAWRRLSAPASVELVRKCVNLRDSMQLNGWGYIRLVEKIADAAFMGRKNESALMQMFILTQSGYKVRIARCDDRLLLLVPCDEIIYNLTYIPISGTHYYITDPKASSGGMHVYDKQFPKEKMFSLEISRQPQLAYEAAQSRRFKSAMNSAIDLDITVNKNLIDFFNDYPLSNHWNIYAKASLSDEVKSKLYPVLREAIEGKSKKSAANVLLHFVQTGFEYMTDGDQFGIERPMFPDESFYYPYNDCEDRAILFSVLVRELLGLDVVLLHYPGHLATAVRFDEPVGGNYFEIDGAKYTVCDPTYINSDVGMAMPQFKSTGAEIMRL
ncbi:MAG: hypothetical protein K2L14_10735 [Duncaniella sp.]|nr:hypothetical protein [Duncaniella sp.]